MSLSPNLVAWLSAIGLAAGSVVAPAAHAHGKTFRLGPVVDVTLTTSNLHRGLTAMPSLLFTNIRPRRTRVLHVSDRRSYQKITGFGAAMTDSSAWLIHDQLPVSQGDSLMDALSERTASA